MSGAPDLVSVQAVLFDLDGTLVDSAPDLAGAANELRQAHGLPALAFEALRPMVGTGARGMLDAAFGIGPGDVRFDALRTDFLNRYEARILRETRVFARMEPVLQALEQRGLPWGIVTNKIARFSVPLVEGLGLMSRCAVLISGDSTAHAKPHPAPLLEAARRLGLCSRSAASTSATTVAMSKPAAAPACRRWRPPGATWAAASRCTTGTPMPCCSTPMSS